MAYAFIHSDNVADQVRAVADEQIDKVLRSIVGSADFDETVHTLRKASKKLRALLRLVRPHFAAFRDENDAIKAIAERFSTARDAAVMVTTLDTIIERAGDGMEADETASCAEIREKLRARAGHLRQQMGEEVLLASAREDFEALKARVGGWHFESKGEALVLAGLERTYRKSRKCMDDVFTDPTALRLHDWRKAAKAHWYHVRLLQRGAPAVLDGLVMRLEELGGLLGDHHNLAVLEDWLRSGTAATDLSQDLLLRLIGERQAELAGSAFALGRQLFVERPGALARRFERYWRLLD
ncbi:CHAD domain-containing protein [Devosia salina]|uniref:CHAD domain-containing protein n=1 Tax=Devosia salina TaxID=2860336 RepID=A0ABX8WDT8_9HYPH|nr:CHAD domain-containing protein [Devosia salina]QYO75141.1 CHAD domain-containing protein [Devosia salina]